LKDGSVSICKYGNEFYAKQWVNDRCLLFHKRLFPDIKPDEVVDHIFGKTLDNRRSQLRVVSRRENNRNTKRNRNGGLYGTCFNKRRNKYMAYITVNKKRVYLGCFYETAEEAHQAVIDYETLHNIK
jgi:hypothetical protein